MIQLLLAIIYVAFISLGLPDAILGSAWPVMYPQFHVPVSYAGIISIVICLGTITSALLSDRLTRCIGTGKITALSVGLTAIALCGFSFSSAFWMLCLWAIPYGLGAGSVDAALNNYVALHYASRHMSWLHCMWGVGACLGPVILSSALTHGATWNTGYFIISMIQVALTTVLILSLPLWKKHTQRANLQETPSESDSSSAMTLREIIALPAARHTIICFLCYCGLETTTGLWASSYLTLHKHISPDIAAGYASLFFIGITVGRGISGFVTLWLDDFQMIRSGILLITCGIILVVLPAHYLITLAGFIIIGLGCAPIYPSIIHATPLVFGAHRSQAMIGVQMAGAYVGSCLLPPLCGLIANHISIALLPPYLGLLTLTMFWHNRQVVRIYRTGRTCDNTGRL